jgi:hypothetical protein
LDADEKENTKEIEKLKDDKIDLEEGNEQREKDIAIMKQQIIDLKEQANLNKKEKFQNVDKFLVMNHTKESAMPAAFKKFCQ